MPMMRVLSSLLFGLMLAAPAAAQEALTCEGAFGIDSSEARLIGIYGRDNVVTGEVDGPEGTTMLATTVFPGDPARELQFTWWDEQTFALPANIALPPGMTGPAALATGMSIEDVQQLNGEPFELTGFFWDYGGYAGFQSGALAELPGGCMLSLSFAPQAEIGEAAMDQVSGDQMLVSDMPMLRDIDTRLVAINFGYPAPEGMFDEMDEPAGDGEGGEAE